MSLTLDRLYNEYDEFMEEIDVLRNRQRKAKTKVDDKKYDREILELQDAAKEVMQEIRLLEAAIYDSE